MNLFSQVRPPVAAVATAIGLAVISNLVFKTGMVFVVGGAPLAKQCAPGLLAVGIGVGAGLWLSI